MEGGVTRALGGLIGFFRHSSGDIGEDGHVCVVLRGEVWKGVIQLGIIHIYLISRVME